MVLGVYIYVKIIKSYVCVCAHVYHAFCLLDKIVWPYPHTYLLLTSTHGEKLHQTWLGDYHTPRLIISLSHRRLSHL